MLWIYGTTSHQSLTEELCKKKETLKFENPPDEKYKQKRQISRKSFCCFAQNRLFIYKIAVKKKKKKDQVLKYTMQETSIMSEVANQIIYDNTQCVTPVT